MDSALPKLKRNMILKAWDRCKSLSYVTKTKSSRKESDSLTKSKSWHCYTRTPTRKEDKQSQKGRRAAPQGCFSVYVGEEKQRFVIKTEFANHPLFKLLLEDAESEYGFNSEGPLLLPCDVDLFYKVLAEMDSKEEISTTPTWSNSLFSSPSCYRQGGAAYKPLTPSRMLKLNRT